MFARRVPDDLSPNRLTLVHDDLRSRGRAIVDLTLANPTVAGFEYPRDLIDMLANPSALVYAPEPFGLPHARAAVAREYARMGVDVPPDRVILTASSSESYSTLFKLFCEPGDNVLVPLPSYPLFEHLCRLDAVVPRPYRLELHDRWTLDSEALGALVDARTRAVLVVSPNNPTGSMLTRGELAAVGEVCRRATIPLIGDEVFRDYPVQPPVGAAASVLEWRETLVVSLGGLSKSIGLPQMKLGWMALGGPRPFVDGALARLELICDTYLSVNTPVQEAAAGLLTLGAGVRAQISDRLLLNYHALREVATAHPACRVHAVEGGWTAVVQVPATMPDEDLAVALLEREGILVHPGDFYDFHRGGFVVMSLLGEPAQFRRAAAHALAALDAQ
jgi:aspartate/methionine/tyrosine aminotransferase